MMKQVGEAVRDFILSCSHKEGEIVTIGIATWGTVYNRESLVCPMVRAAHGIALPVPGFLGKSCQGLWWNTSF